ncbi:MAG: porin family protein [Oligoflexia bacterium]|nr:porin family protein [Oligoflexia bacterium]
MLASTSTSSRRTPALAALLAWLTPLLVLSGLAGNPIGAVALAADAPKTDRTLTPEEDDFADTPFTEYGEFNEEAEEASETKFFQYGRFFGVSLGLGYEGATGNRGLLWKAGMPVFDFKVHYWFDFNMALDLGITTVRHSYETSDANGRHVDVNLVRMGLDLRYYFDTKNMSAPISFANPFVLLGIGSYAKSEVASIDTSSVSSDSAFGVAAGGGLEFILSPRRSFFQIEGKVHLPEFKDTNLDTFNSDPNYLPDLNGMIYTVTGNLLFTW